MTELLYMNDCYLKQCNAVVHEVIDDTKVVLDRTVFYPEAGGVPCDTGRIICKAQAEQEFIVLKVKKQDNKIMHYVNKKGISKGDQVHCIIDWERRYVLMQYHTAAHVLAGTFHTDTGAMITGNQIGLEKTRFDFNLQNFDKQLIEKQVKKANSYFGTDVPVTISYMSRDKALAIPGMVKLAKVLPPQLKTLRIIKIGNIDTQADGGCHVKNLKEVPDIKIIKLENKGKNNRRVYFRFVE